MELKGQLEAILFIAGETGMKCRELTGLTGYPVESIQMALDQLKSNYEMDSESPFCLLEIDDLVVMTTKKELAPLLKKLAQAPLQQSLSKASLETLSIIAYKQPLTRMEMDDIRGVNSSAALQKLLLLRLIEEKGRQEGPGRPILYGTTKYFMNYFGLKNLNDLPDIAQMEADLLDDSFELFLNEKDDN
jgi:segregation and condensation protein B